MLEKIQNEIFIRSKVWEDLKVYLPYNNFLQNLYKKINGKFFCKYCKIDVSVPIWFLEKIVTWLTDFWSPIYST